MLSTPWRGRGVAVKVDRELDCQALDLLHIRYAEAGGVQPCGKVMKLSLVGEVLASILAKRRMLQRRASLCTGSRLAELLSPADAGHASWNKRWPWMSTGQPTGASCTCGRSATSVLARTLGTAGKHPPSACPGSVPRVAAHATGGPPWWCPGLPDEHSSAVASALPLPGAPGGCHLRRRELAAAKARLWFITNLLVCGALA